MNLTNEINLTQQKLRELMAAKEALGDGDFVDVFWVEYNPFAQTSLIRQAKVLDNPEGSNLEPFLTDNPVVTHLKNTYGFGFFSRTAIQAVEIHLERLSSRIKSDHVEYNATSSLLKTLGS